MATPQDIIVAARSLVGARYAHQGRNREVGFDCAGVLITVGQLAGVSEFEFLGYSADPDGYMFESLLEEKLRRLNSVWFARPGDVLSFDFGKGTQHVAIITKLIENRFDWRRFTVVHAIRRPSRTAIGVLEGPLTPIYSDNLQRAYAVPGVTR